MKKNTRKIVYKCTGAAHQGDRLSTKDDLLAKRVVFHKLGLKGKQVRSRTVDWLCDACVKKDPAWNAKALSATPGFADTRLGEQEDSEIITYVDPGDEIITHVDPGGEIITYVGPGGPNVAEGTDAEQP